ncbi:uncharacterized protein KD926_000709 [Aspergillus affinis]|uniref:uncharacterized protein n=1 Tax=Aspergillus affinis TaxID=1070780 RepID=UPI0022FE65CE|nr:uncharacterized protein KD926_000709 [Aspergillus affinis]KAI9037204.1 hypothetical protein KD926_000709 [Aspergillus affinis]
MDAKRKFIYSEITRIRKTLERYKRLVLQDEQLKRLGVRATAVDLTANKFQKFKPCFFVPRGIKFTNAQNSRNSSQHDSVERGNKRLQLLKDHAESVRPRVQFPAILSTIHDTKINALKDEGFDLFQFTSLSRLGSTGSLLSKEKWPFNPELRLSEQRHSFNRWQVYLCLEDRTHAAPHAIMDVLVDANDPGVKLH